MWTDERFHEVVDRARRTWPGVELSDEAFAAALAARVPEEALADGSALERVHGVDLYLVEACVRNDPSAHAAFSELVERVIARPVSAIVGNTNAVEDVRQVVCQRLLVPEQGNPRIADYTGTTTLSTWVRVIATRIAIDERRRRSRDRQLDDTLVEHLESDGLGPQLGELKAKYRARFKGAIAAAVATLSERDRGVLRFTVEHGLTADEIGRIYHVHRVTVARWLRRIRDTLTNQIMRELQVERSEIASMLRLVRSQLSLSIVRMLAN